MGPVLPSFRNICIKLKLVVSYVVSGPETRQETQPSR